MQAAIALLQTEAGIVEPKLIGDIAFELTSRLYGEGLIDDEFMMAAPDLAKQPFPKQHIWFACYVTTGGGVHFVHVDSVHMRPMPDSPPLYTSLFLIRTRLGVEQAWNIAKACSYHLGEAR